MILVGVLLVLGQVMLFSASGIMGIQRHESEFYYSFRQAVCATIGLLLLWILSNVKVDFWKKAAPSLFAIQLVLVFLTLFSPFRVQAQGASRWLNFWGFTLQPSELARISLTFYMAHLLSSSEKCGFSQKRWLGHAAAILVLLLMVFRQPDLGSMILLLSIVLGLLFLSGIRPVLFLGMIGAGSGAIAIAMLSSEYRRRRITAFLNPWSEPQGAGFQTIQSLLSIHSGKFAGVGIGNGNSKLFYLPEVHTDFIFSLTAEELGFVGAAVVVCLFALLGLILFRAASRASDSFSRFVIFGLSFSLMLQVCVNVGGVTGLLPIKGLPLPFFSWGRSALITHLAMIGVIISCIRGGDQRVESKSVPTIGSVGNLRVG